MLTGTSYSSYTNINQFMTHIERGVLMAQMFNDIEIIQTITQELTFDEQQLFEQQNITGLPGRYLSRESMGINPGEGYVRLAMVAEVEECQQAAQRLLSFAKYLKSKC